MVFSSLSVGESWSARSESTAAFNTRDFIDKEASTDRLGFSGDGAGDGWLRTRGGDLSMSFGVGGALGEIFSLLGRRVTAIRNENPK